MNSLKNNRAFQGLLAIIGVSIIFNLSACKLIEINGSLAGLTSQFYRNYRENDSLYQYIDSAKVICDLVSSNKVLIVSDQNLKPCINSNKKIIVYSWGPFCTSGFCYPLDLIYAKCLKNNILFLPVSEYYDNNLMASNVGKGFPLLAPNISFYKTNITGKYLSQFYSNLGVKDYLEGRFHYFNNGKYVRAFEEIGTIDSL